MSDGDNEQDKPSEPIINVNQYVENMSGGTVIGHQTNITKQTVRTCPTAPNPPKHFTGRVEELQFLRSQLTGTEVIAVTAVRSMGGMGKTTLAQALCHLPDNPFGAVLWAEITQNPQTASILSTWGQYADSEYRLPSETPLEQIADHVRAMLTDLVNDHCGGQTLVVFDDVWEDSLAAVEILRRAAPTGAQILITTRQDQVINDPRIKARALNLNELSDIDARVLLQKLISHPAVTDVHLDRAVRLLKGHPLALELAAASLNLAEDAGHIQDILDDYEKGIAEGSPFDALNLETEMPRSLNVVFGRSYNALSQDLQTHFRALGILAPDAVWNRPLAGAVWGMNDEKAIRTIHQSLRTRALIAADKEANQSYGEGWYRQHPLLQTYARALLNRPEHADEHQENFNHYADYIIGQTAQFDELSLEQWGQLDPLLPHVQEIGDTLVRLTVGEGLRPSRIDQPSPTHPLEINPNADETLLRRAGDFAWNVTRYVYYRPQMIETTQGRVLRGLDWLEMGLSIYQGQGNQDRQATTLSNIGVVWSTLGETRMALAFHEQVLALRQAAGDQRGEAITLNNIALAWGDLGETRKALEFHEQALLLRQAAGDQRGEAVTLNNIGLAWDDLGEKHKALECYEQALPLRRAVRDQDGEAVTLNNIGLAWFALGETRKALEFYEQALPLRRAVGDRRGEAATLTNIGGVWDALGEKRKALEFYDQALPLDRAVGNRRGEATTLTSIGKAWSALGEKHKALEFYEQALPLSRAVGNKHGEAVTLNNIGGAWSALGEKRKALEFYEQALPLSRAVGDRDGEAITLNNIGLVWFELGEKRKALEFYEQALPLSRAVGDRRNEAVTLNNIAGVWDDLGETGKALEFYEQALALSQAVGDRHGEATALNNISYIYFQHGEFEKTAAVQQQIIELVRSLGDIASEALYLFNNAIVYQRLGRIDDAIQAAETGREIFIRYNLAHNAGGGTIAEYDALLAQLRGEELSEEEQFAQAMQMLTRIYVQGGAEAVRAALAGQVDDAVIEQVIVDLAAGSGGS